MSKNQYQCKAIHQRAIVNINVPEISPVPTPQEEGAELDGVRVILDPET